MQICIDVSLIRHCYTLDLNRGQCGTEIFSQGLVTRSSNLNGGK